MKRRADKRRKEVEGGELEDNNERFNLAIYRKTNEILLIIIFNLRFFCMYSDLFFKSILF